MRRVKLLAHGATLNLSLLLVVGPCLRAQGAAVGMKPWVWPDAPNEGKPSTIADLDKSTYQVQIERPQAAVPPQAPADRPASSIPSIYRGRIAYGTRSTLLKAGERPPQSIRENKYYLVLRSIGFKGLMGGRLTDVASYPRKSFFDPPAEQLFYRNGEALYSKASSAVRNDSGPVYIWDFQSKRLRQASWNNSLSQIFLSPNWRWAVQTRFDGDEVPDAPWKPFEGKELYVFDLQAGTGKSTKIAEHASQRSVAWTASNTLLYTQQPPEAGGSSGRPSIREVPGAGGASQLVIPDGYDAAPSPDNRYIAFFGWPQSPAVQDADEITELSDPNSPASIAARTPRLWLFERASGKRYLVSEQNSGFLAWTPDSRRLVMVKTGDAGAPDAGNPAQVSLINLADILAASQDKPAALAIRPLATIAAKDTVSATRIWPRNFRLAGMARNGQYIVLDESEFIGQNPELPVYIHRKSLIGVELDSGRVTTLTTLVDPSGDVQGWDWHDDSDSSGNNVTVSATSAPGQGLAPSASAAPKRPAASRPAPSSSRSRRGASGARRR